MIMYFLCLSFFYPLISIFIRSPRFRPHRNRERPDSAECRSLCGVWCFGSHEHFLLVRSHAQKNTVGYKSAYFCFNLRQPLAVLVLGIWGSAVRPSSPEIFAFNMKKVCPKARTSSSSKQHPLTERPYLIQRSAISFA